jgi:hypothetical protein
MSACFHILSWEWLILGWAATKDLASQCSSGCAVRCWILRFDEINRVYELNASEIQWELFISHFFFHGANLVPFSSPNGGFLARNQRMGLTAISRSAISGACLVPKILQNFSRFTVTSNLWTHAWSIKYR